MITSSVQVFCTAIKKQGPIVGIDFGIKKFGIAISNQELTFALPLFVLKANIREIKPTIDRYRPTGIVLGIPINMDGSVGAQALLVQKFASKVMDAFGLPILLQDERLTTRAATNSLKSFGLKRKERDKVDDTVAACLLLESAMSGIGLL
jgi:putative Holliday junction resolvase